MPNAIPTLQNAEPQLKLMRARQQTYANATGVLVFQLVLTVMVPVLSAIAGMIFQDIRPWTAGLALLITILDVSLLDRLQRQKLKLAAKFAEMFDNAVLDIPWNRFVAGKRPDHESIDAAASAWSRRKSDERLIDWYPPAVGQARLYLARILCQRTNLWYDAKLRANYADWIRAAAFLIVAALFISAFAIGLTVYALVSTVLAPAAPLLTWAMREYFRQKDTAEAQDTLKADAEDLWERAKAGKCVEAECAAQSREFQNAIYIRRATSPLILPFLYPWCRPTMERQMNVGAEQLLRDINIGR